jgi:hypothetical protein
MSDVERFWDALRPKWTNTPQKSWHELSPQKQMMIMQALQIMIQAMSIE